MYYHTGVLRRCAIFLFFFLAAAGARADITLVHRVRVEGKEGEVLSETREARMIQAMRMREEHADVRTQTVVLTKLDQGLIQTLDPETQTVREIRVSDLKGAPASPPLPAAATHEIIGAQFHVEATKQTAMLHGFPSRRSELQIDIDLREKATQERSHLRLQTTLWTAPERGVLKTLQDEELRFLQRLARAVGGDETGRWRGFDGAAIASWTGAAPEEVARALEQLSQEMRKVKGYLLRSESRFYRVKDGMPVKNGEPLSADHITVSELIRFSTTPLEASLFDVPSEFRRLSEPAP
jgi:hypothetical protein